MSGELCACFVVHCDSRWNCGIVQQSIVIVCRFVRMPRGLYWLSVEICACVVVHSDFRWNCGRVHYSNMIVHVTEEVFISL